MRLYSTRRLVKLTRVQEVQVEVGVANEEFYVRFKTFESSSAPLVPVHHYEA